MQQGEAADLTYHGLDSLISLQSQTVEKWPHPNFLIT